MTVPTDVARQFCLQTDELLDIRVAGDAFVVSPQRTAGLLRYHPMCFWGLGRVSGAGNDADIDRQLRALRNEWER